MEEVVDSGAGDLDGDGFSNLEEYLLGTDPNSSGSGVGGCKGCATTGAGGGWGVALGAVALLGARRRPRHPLG